MKYFQTDDRDDYFATLSKNKKLRIKPTYSIFKDERNLETFLGSFF
jgi:hypothetical protein